jgi:hypothetical protein
MAQSEDDQTQQWADALSRMTQHSPAPGPAPEPLGPEAPTSQPPQAAGSRPVRPAVPSSASHEPSRSAPASHDLFDDDHVNIPAPTPDTFLRPRPSAPKSSQLSTASIESRRTLVPILLTCGALFPLMGGLWFLTDVDSPFRRLSSWMPIALIVIGALLLFLGIANAMQLKHLLAQRQRR